MSKKPDFADVHGEESNAPSKKESPQTLDFTGFFEGVFISCRDTKNDLYHAFYLFTNLYISIFYYAQIFKGENS